MGRMGGRTHLVLGGGGAMGAFQAGTLAALLEAGVVPDAVYGCSAGALNAAFLAVRPDAERAVELEAWWLGGTSRGVLAPSWSAAARGLAVALRTGGGGLLDARPLRRLIAGTLGNGDIADFSVPLTVTTTCLDCGAPIHHEEGWLVDVLVASCALPGLFAPVLLTDGHLHVDGGVLSGVPVSAALQAAGPDDRVLVLDCGLAPVTGRVDSCAAQSPLLVGRACGLPVLASRTRYEAPVEHSRGALDVVLKAFTVARAAANRASVGRTLDDPRVAVLPHIADAWAAGLLVELPRGPRDFAQTPALLRAGRLATQRWLSFGLHASAPESDVDARRKSGSTN
jgi:predicted acylesterase/phospholipase RssA